MISEEIGDFMKTLCSEICKEHGGEMISAESDVDHLHLLISMPPQERPSDVIRVLKTQTSKKIHLNAEYDKIKEYVDSQRTEYHKRKYEKTGRYKKKK